MGFISILQVFRLKEVIPNKVLKPNYHLRSTQRMDVFVNNFIVAFLGVNMTRGAKS